MKWKITIRFMLAMLVVSVVSGLFNVLISIYYSYEDYNANQTFDRVFSPVFSIGGCYITTVDEFGSVDDLTITLTDKSAVLKDDAENDTLTFKMYGDTNGEPVLLMEGLEDSLLKDNGWIQVINSAGEEIGNINKPAEIKTLYTQGELDKAVNDTIKMNKYIVKAFLNKSDDSGNRMAFMLGVPKPRFDLENMVSYNLDYFRYMDTQKVISVIVTLVGALVLGYLLAIRLNKPVVRITDGITAMAGGNYDVDFTEDSYYKNVFISLNNMASTLRAATLEREKVEKIREEWVTNISHDLKTPLSSIKGYSELLHESGNGLSKEELQKYIGVILEKTDYMDALINDLKLTQSLKNEAFPLNKKKENLVELLRDTVIGILNDAKFQSRHIHFNSESEDVWMEFDSHLLKRAFTNLVMNSLVHNEEGTEIWVSIYHADMIIVEISDNGKGITPDEQDNLFERYYRGTSTNDFYDGSGLGLAISREIIQVHGGSITLQSSVGKGTVVRVSL